MTSPATSPDPARVVREVLEAARRAVGSGPRFAARLEELGVGPERGRYSESAISNWINGRTMPPADVLLAAADIASLSLDGWILSEGRSEQPAGWQEAAAHLQAQLDALRSEVIDLYGRLGYAMPQRTETAPTRPAAAGE